MPGPPSSYCMPYVFDLDTLAQRGRDAGAAFRSAEPYPYAVFDDFLRASAAQEIARVFPGPQDPVAWDHYAAPGLEVKLGCSREERLPEPIRRAIQSVQGEGCCALKRAHAFQCACA